MQWRKKDTTQAGPYVSWNYLGGIYLIALKGYVTLCTKEVVDPTLGKWSLASFCFSFL